VCSRKSDHD
jgi:hypothetical protein